MANTTRGTEEHRTGFIPVLVLLSASAVLALGWIFQVDNGICNGCAICISHCPTGALSMVGPDAYIDPELCDGCGDCVPYCIRGAIYRCWYEGIEETAPMSELSASPNPSAGSFIVEGIEPGASLAVVDISGRSVWVGSAGSDGTARVVLGNGATGLYGVMVDGSAPLMVTVRTQRI